MGSKYDVSRDFCDGYAEALRSSIRSQFKNVHWLAGYDAGYAARVVRTERLQQYLHSLGMEPLLEIRPQEP